MTSLSKKLPCFVLLIVVFLSCRLDRKKQRAIKDWSSHHSSYIEMFKHCLEQANTMDPPFWPHSSLAFDNYLRWFVGSTRVEICTSAYDAEILENPTDEYDELAMRGYNKLVREGSQTPFAPVINFLVSKVCLHLLCNSITCLPLFACLTCAFPFILSGRRSRKQLMRRRNFSTLTRRV